ncbi:dihydropyrimidinase-like isoform X1 [Primulina eburnea]|uniref:dihydropyrimidinase-like isoform X1 n=1 Tax=Primulina eburnea TaxID=1245227 RepID=UPI003C6BE34B
MRPPIIRAPGHGKALQAALSTGILQASGKISSSDFVRWTSTEWYVCEIYHLKYFEYLYAFKISIPFYSSARVFDIYPRKGAILVGSDADIIVLNPDSSFKISSATHHSQSDTNVYEGRKGKGKIEVTIAGGKIVWENEELKVVPGSGKS